MPQSRGEEGTGVNVAAVLMKQLSHLPDSPFAVPVNERDTGSDMNTLQAINESYVRTASATALPWELQRQEFSLNQSPGGKMTINIIACHHRYVSY